MNWRQWLRRLVGWFWPRVESADLSSIDDSRDRAPADVRDRAHTEVSTAVETSAGAEQPPEPPTSESEDTEPVAELEPEDEQPAEPEPAEFEPVAASLVPVDLNHPGFLIAAAFYETAPPVVREALAALTVEDGRAWLDQMVMVHNGVLEFQAQQQHEARLEWLRGELFRLSRYGPRGPRDSLVVGLEALSLGIDPTVVRAAVQAADRTNGTAIAAAGRRHRTPEAW
jgi:hypothetical protein